MSRKSEVALDGGEGGKYRRMRAVKVAYRLATSLPLLDLGGFLGQTVILDVGGGFGEGFLFKVLDLRDRGFMIDS